MLSFIIPAYNEEAVIARTVQAVHEAARAAGGDYEIIVVDDASTDRTAELAAQHGARVVSVNKRQIAATRNAGARAAKGDVFFFIDADTLVPGATITAALDALKNGAVAGGAQVRFDGKVSFLTRALLRVFMEAFSVLRLAPGCFMYCTRQAFDGAGGFDERFFASEEVWFSKALKLQGKFVMVRQPVITSGRKIRDHGTPRLLLKMAMFALRGPGRLQKREGLDLWYDGRRETVDER
jgi:glycosyltransferase involved in cell wall biosynthesis